MGRGKSWTKEEENSLRRIFSDSSFEAMSEYLERSIFSIKSKARELGLKKERIEGIHDRPRTVNLIYRNEVVKCCRALDTSDVLEAFSYWLTDIRPALKRREKVVLEIEMD